MFADKENNYKELNRTHDSQEGTSSESSKMLMKMEDMNYCKIGNEYDEIPRVSHIKKHDFRLLFHVLKEPASVSITTKPTN